MSSIAGFIGNPDLLSPNGSLAALTSTFVIIICRVSAVIMTSPGLGDSSAPSRIRAGIALATTVAILPVVNDHIQSLAGEAMRMPSSAIMIIAEEILCGIFIGLLARLITLSIAISMQIVSVFTGMSSVIQPDSQLGSSSTAISHMANSLIPVIIFTTGMYALPLFAIVGSYNLFPPGHITMQITGDMAHSISQAIGETFSIAMQLSAPFVLIGTLWPAMLGVLNKLMPTLQVYSVAMPAQLLGSLLLLALLIQVVTGTWQERIQGFLLELPGIQSLTNTPPHPKQK